MDSQVWQGGCNSHAADADVVASEAINQVQGMLSPSHAAVNPSVSADLLNHWPALHKTCYAMLAVAASLLNT